MKKYLKALVMTFSMFLIIPCPFKIWDEESRPYMNIFLPFVGAIIGGINFLVCFLLDKINTPFMIIAFLMTFIPLLLTGFMHLDGFIDTVDAIGSYREKEERIRILKDSHVGAFGVISVSLLLLATFVFSNYVGNLYMLIFIPILSRILSAIVLMVLPKISVSEYSDRKIKVGELVYYIILIGVIVALSFIFFGFYGFSLLFMMLMYLLHIIKPMKSLEGVNGDVAGFLISSSEFYGILGVAIVALIWG